MKPPMPLLLRGDARALPLPDSSVDLIVTSPPYFGLRSYSDGGEHYAGQLGSEPTPAEFLDALIECTREMVRILKPSGSIWVNLGDKYAAAAQGPVVESSTLNGRKPLRGQHNPSLSYGTAKAKSLLLLPHRYAIRCADELGLIVRQDQVWSKCLSGGTTVYARTKGRAQTIRLHDLCRNYQPEDVQLWTGEKWSQVRTWEPTARSEAQFEFELRSGERIGCTPEHRWPTNRGLLRADEVRIGDTFDTCPLPDGEATPAALDDEMIGWFVGLYIAEGSCSEQTIQFAGHVKELERFKRLSEIAAAFHGTARVHATGGNTATINVTGNMLRAILDTYVGGRTSKDKFLTPKCWQRSNRFLRAVLDGYLESAGHWRQDAHRWVLGFTNNDQLATDLRALGARIGMSVRLRRTTHTGYGQEWPGWGGSITEPRRRRQSDSEVVAIRPSRARQFWDVAIEDEPHLFALASGVLTHNSNGLPESVTDRTRRSHEYVFHMVKLPRYYSAVDEIRGSTQSRAGQMTWEQRKARGDAVRQGEQSSTFGGAGMAENPLGKLPGSVWEIPSQPLKVPAALGVDHFAAYPMALVRPIILGWSPREVCTVCGEGRRPVVAARQMRGGEPVSGALYGPGKFATATGRRHVERTDRARTGSACACPDTTAPTTPGVVVDPFGGTATTALVATMLGRRGVSVDMSADYCRLAQWRAGDPKERARAAGLDPDAVAQATAQLPGQVDMFDLLGGDAA